MPVHTVAATPDGAFNMQSYAAASAPPLARPLLTHVSDARLPAARFRYHCPVVQATCQPDYYPCGASAAVAFGGKFTAPDGNIHHIIFVGERVLVDGKVCVGVNNTTDFLRPTRTGRLTGVATPLHVGRLQHLWEVEITRDDDKVAARGQVRLQVLDADRF